MSWSLRRGTLGFACVALALLVLLLIGSRARAWGEPIGVMLEPTHALPVPVFLKGGEDVITSRPERVPYTLDASISLHVPLTSSLVQLDARDGWAHAFVFIPRVDLRHGRADSYPIRTPGYYPTVRFQVFHQRHVQSLRRRVLAEFFFAHHSNGQSGCLYRDQLDPPNGRCRFDDGDEASGSALNHIDGSFATNEVGLRAGLDLVWGPKQSAWRATALLGAVLFRPLVGGIDPEIQEVYGIARSELWLRLGKRLGGEGKLASELGLRLRADVRFGGELVRAPANVVVDSFWCLDVMRDWGPFVRVVAGSDPYNIRFDSEVLALGFGMMWEP